MLALQNNWGVMRTKSLVIASTLAFLITGAHGQQEQRFVLLPASEVSNLAKDYPQYGPDKIDGSWLPSESQIGALEANVRHISDLRNGGAPNGEKIVHPEQYYRQYVAVVRAGQSLIYVNALCRIGNASYWRDHLYRVMDGGSCAWQAWYDPATEKFLSLSINGRA